MAISVRTWRVLAPLVGRVVLTIVWRRVRNVQIEAQVWMFVSGEQTEVEVAVVKPAQPINCGIRLAGC
jgi:hypothetical protein